MTEWNEQRLEELKAKLQLRFAFESADADAGPNKTATFPRIMRLDAAAWAAMGYDETDRVSVTRYLGSLGCWTGDALRYAAVWQRPLTLELAKALIDAGAGTFNKDALSAAAKHQRPLTLELAKLLIDAGAFNKDALSVAAAHQRLLTLELAKLLIDAGCDPAAQNYYGWDALVYLAWGGYPVDPQVTDLFLSRGCRTNLGGCMWLDEDDDGAHRLRFDQILKEHAEWKLAQECVPVDGSCDMDWGK